MIGRFRKRDVQGGAAALALVMLLVAGTTEKGAEAAVTVMGMSHLSIPAQSLRSALDAFTAQTNVQVLYDSNLAQGRTSVAVSGNLAADSALAQLLTGTGLLVHYTNPDRTSAILVAKADPTSTAGAMAQDGVMPLATLHVTPGPQLHEDDYRSYATVVQAVVQHAFDRDSQVLSGRYTIGVALWVSKSGAITRSEIFQSTGDPTRDALVQKTLATLAISQSPPDNMPQPVKVVVVARRWQASAQ